MSRKKRISDSVRKLIVQESLENPDVPRRVLAFKLHAYIDKMGEVAPAEETLIKMISDARNNEPDPLDAPWSLKASIDYSFPAESTPYLLRAWKLCFALGIPFSIRQAQWASYLSTVVSSPKDLIMWSYRYASLEKVHKVLNIPFVSVDMDVTLTSSVSEIRSLAMMAKMKPVELPGGFVFATSTPVSFEQDAIVAAKQVELASLFYDEPILPVKIDPSVLQPVEELNLSQEFIWIYCYWLSCLQKSPKWKQLQRSEVIDMIKELRAWLFTLPEITSQISQDMLNLIVVQKKYVSLEEWVFQAKMFPPERILKQLGYFTDDPIPKDFPSFIKNFPGNWFPLLQRIIEFNTKLDSYSNKLETELNKEGKK